MRPPPLVKAVKRFSVWFQSPPERQVLSSDAVAVAGQLEPMMQALSKFATLRRTC